MSEQDRILAGRYRLIELLGEGGMGSVWRAEHVELHSQLAVKLIDEELAQSVSVLARFRQEAKAAAALTSTHVVRTFDYGVDEGTPFIAMELLKGESLDDRLKRVGRVSPAETALMLTHVARALEQAHARGTVHRDMKPGNIFITHGEDGQEIIKVLDFGIAKSLREDGTSHSQTRTGVLVGSPIYMSPEQMRASKAIDHTSDLWSLGVVTYECAVGERPFVGESMVELTVAVCMDPLPVPSEHGSVPAGFDEWFARACSREPAERFQSAKEMAQAFEELAEGYVAVPGEEGEAAGPPADRASSGSTSSSGTVMGRSTAALVRTRPATAGDKPPKRHAARTAVVAALAAVIAAAAVALWLRAGTGPAASESIPAAAESATLAPAAATGEPEVTPVASSAAAASSAERADSEKKTEAEGKQPARAAAPPVKKASKPSTGTRPAPAKLKAPRPAPAKPSGRDYGF